VLSDGFDREQTDNGLQASILPRWARALAAALVVIVFVAAALGLPDQNTLMSKISQNFPVKACDFMRKSALPPPLFNAYIWGGFLIWYSPQYPVVVDSRNEVYGDEMLDRYFQVTGGKQPLDSDPGLGGARTLLLERQSGMAKAFITLPALSSQYRMVYSDDLAAVFVRQ